MFQATVHVDERANVANEVSALSSLAAGSGADHAVTSELAGRFAEVLAPLVESGRLLKSQGSHLDVTRTIEGKGYSVTLKFGVGHQSGFWNSLKTLLRLH